MSDLEAEYRLDYFEAEGFVRTECDSCGAHFWSRDHDRELCGEPPCADYSFIDDPGFPESYTLSEMREAFLSFFESNGHERIDPYPVAANRWRDDVLLTQASIYDFQPLVTSGETPPPANPLTISQPCIRMQDIDNVGKTGRHTMAFEMMAHHAFNTREDAEGDYAYEGEVYWKDETVRYCDELFESLGADLSEITYIEDPWVGGGNAGPAIEVIYKGAELATLVFMCMEQDPDGEYEMKDGNTYSFMDTYIVDTGYGLERWTWMSQGTATVYEAVYPDAIEFLKGNAGIEHTETERELIHRAAKLSGRLDIDDVDDVEAARGDIADTLDVDVGRLRELVEPLESIYAIADHSRTLAYMFGDGIVPSNVGTGYLARMVLRRTKRLVDEVGVDAPLDELVDMQAERLGYENRDTIREIVRTEERKYRKTLERGSRKVEALADEYAGTGEPIPTNELLELYDSHGIQPDMVAEIAAERGADVDVPDDFYALVADRHEESDDAGEGTERDDRLADLPKTEKLFYDDQGRMEFEAVVLDVFERDEGYDVVVFDTAPTGHTIRLMELPSDWNAELEKGGSTCIGPAASMEDKKAQYERAIDTLQNGERTAFAFVGKPEDSSIDEIERSASDLADLGIDSQLLILNGYLPESVCEDPFFEGKRADEQAVIERAREEFDADATATYPLQPGEIAGLDLLADVGSVLYDGAEATVDVGTAADENGAGAAGDTGIDFKALTDPDAAVDQLTPGEETEYLFFTGKGGVGKSTIASTAATKLAEAGHETLVVTTDPAAHLEDIFGEPVGHEPTSVSQANLDAARIDQEEALAEYRKQVLDHVTEMYEEKEDTRIDVDAAIANVEEELESPCAEEMAALEKFVSYFDEDGYDVVVFDTAPTGHTLRLLELPSDWKGVRDLGSLTKGAAPAKGDQYDEVIETMKDPERSTFAFVMYPEYTPMMEAYRAAEDLRDQVGIETSLVVANYLLPEEHGDNAFFANRRAQQATYLEEIRDRFDAPLMSVPLRREEPIGLAALRAFGEAIPGLAAIPEADAPEVTPS